MDTALWFPLAQPCYLLAKLAGLAPEVRTRGRVGAVVESNGRSDGWLDPALVRRLEASAEGALERAYTPYVGFRVGAAVLCGSGHIYVGANIENASAGASLCAERAAFTHAICAGDKDFRAIALAFDVNPENATAVNLVPCGICLQWMFELAPSIRLSVCNTRETYRLSELLPRPFSIGTVGRREGY